MEDYIDSKGFLHHIPSVGCETSENAPTFTVCGKLHGLKLYPSYEELILSKRILRTTPISEWGGHFSHDSLTALYAFRKLDGLPVSDLPICYWNGRWWLHPRDLAMYSYLHWPYICWIFLPVVFIAAVVSCLAPDAETSGKQNVFIRTRAFNLTFTKWVTDKLVEWKQVFTVYYKDINHPIRGTYENSF